MNLNLLFFNLKWKEADTLKLVGAKPSKWGPDTLKSLEWLFMGLNGSIQVPTWYPDPLRWKLLCMSTPKRGPSA